MKGRWGERFARRVSDDIQKPAAGNRSSLTNWLTTIFSGSRDHAKVAQSREFRQIGRAEPDSVLHHPVRQPNPNTTEVFLGERCNESKSGRRDGRDNAETHPQFASFASTAMDGNFWSESNAGSNQRSETTLRPPACALRLKLSRSQPQQKLFSRQAEDIVAFEALFSSVN